MSTERIIHLADLAFIENSLRTLRSDIGTVSNQVENVGQEVVNTRSELARLEQAFLEPLSNFEWVAWGRFVALRWGQGRAKPGCANP
jgi:hypothetical protein